MSDSRWLHFVLFVSLSFAFVAKEDQPNRNNLCGESGEEGVVGHDNDSTFLSWATCIPLASMSVCGFYV